jgi:rhamnulokinase
MTARRVVAVDLGATSGRVMVARVGTDPDVLGLVEVHRFPNGGVRHEDGSLRWDVERLHREVLTGIRRAAASGRVDGIGIDSWAVDHGLLDADGQLLAAPYSHRDGRTTGVPEQVAAVVPSEELYAGTGVQELPFNTLYQLAAARDAGELTDAASLLLLPDLLGYWLTGVVGAERTNASTTAFYGAASRDWEPELLRRLDLPAGLLPRLRSPGDVVGTLLPEVAAGLRLPSSVPVIAVASHDTASAVVGVPAAAGPVAFISSGTWSLVGLELDRPVLSEEARRAHFSNEGGADDTIRFLTNVMGLWVLSECQRQWAGEGLKGVELWSLLEAAAGRQPLVTVVDIDDPRLLPPATGPDDGMATRVAALAGEAGEPVPTDPVALTRCVLDSLALAYRRTLRTACALTGEQPAVVHVVGGGSRNDLLCQLTADACGLPVLAGPAEAAALGNVLVQARALGVEVPTLSDMRALLRRTQVVRRFEPRPGADWAAAEARLPAREG